MGNAESQFVALAIVPKITSSISIPCQIWIIRQVIADHVAKRGKATSRALLGMGVVDVLASFGWFLSTWAAPRGDGTSGVPFASGNTGSCTFQGFLLQLAIGAPMYNCLLALYYLLTICHSWSDERLRRVEWVCHAFIILFAVGSGIALIPAGMYNHIGAICWTMGLPQGCGNSNYQPGDVPCERGDYAWIYGISLFYGPLWVCIVLTTTFMGLIYHRVRTTERRSRRHSAESVERDSVNRADAGGGGTGRGRKNPSATTTTAATGQRKRRRRSDGVFFQAVLYTAAFYVTWAPSTLWSITQWSGTPMFWLDLLATICEPSQGLLNLLVFIRPRKDLKAKLRRDLVMVLTCGLCRGGEELDATLSSEDKSRPSAAAAPVTAATTATTASCSGQGDASSPTAATTMAMRQHMRVSLLNTQSVVVRGSGSGSGDNDKGNDYDGKQGRGDTLCTPIHEDEDRAANEEEEHRGEDEWEEHV